MSAFAFSAFFGYYDEAEFTQCIFSRPNRKVAPAVLALSEYIDPTPGLTPQERADRFSEAWWYPRHREARTMKVRLALMGTGPQGGSVTAVPAC